MSKRGGEAGTDDGRAELSTIRLFQNAAPSRSACTISIAGRDRKNAAKMSILRKQIQKEQTLCFLTQYHRHTGSRSDSEPVSLT